MQTRKLGPFEVSSLGLGCMNLSMGYGPADAAESEQLLLEALDAGYNFLDTAAMYGDGHNEKLLGRVLSARRDQVILASKCGISKTADHKLAINGRPEAIRATCEQSLKNLQTEIIDLYYLHRIDPQVAVEESAGALGDLVTEGKIRTIGLSEASTENLHRAHGEHPVTAVQSEYSLWSRTPERKMLAACKELGVTFVPFSPLARGFLAGAAQDVSKLGEDDLRASIARPRFEPDNFVENSKLLVPFRKIAESQGCTMAQLALAWILANEEGTLVPIPGTRNLKHMKENAGAESVALDQKTVLALDDLINEETIEGDRYNATLMESTDSEKD